MSLETGLWRFWRTSLKHNSLLWYEQKQTDRPSVFLFFFSIFDGEVSGNFLHSFLKGNSSVGKLGQFVVWICQASTQWMPLAERSLMIINLKVKKWLNPQNCYFFEIRIQTARGSWSLVLQEKTHHLQSNITRKLWCRHLDLGVFCNLDSKKCSCSLSAENHQLALESHVCHASKVCMETSADVLPSCQLLEGFFLIVFTFIAFLLLAEKSLSWVPTISNDFIHLLLFPFINGLPGGLPGYSIGELEAFDLAQRMKDQGHAVSLICGTTGWPSADLWRHKKRLKRWNAQDFMWADGKFWEYSNKKVIPFLNNPPATVECFFLVMGA